MRAARTQDVAPFSTAEPFTETDVAAPDDANVTVARDVPSSPATHAFAAGITAPIAALTAVAGGSSDVVPACGACVVPEVATAGAGGNELPFAAATIAWARSRGAAAAGPDDARSTTFDCEDTLFETVDVGPCDGSSGASA